MSNPTEGPFLPAAPTPQRGDADILPRGTIARPTRERMPFTKSGELIPEGPQLPAGFLRAPDIEGLPWKRKRGNEWTDAAFRQIVFDFLIRFFLDRAWPKNWDVTERATADRMTAFRLPDDQHYLVIGITQADGQRFETSAAFPVARRDVASARVILDRMAAALDALRP
jgi:hypothetical protein